MIELRDNPEALLKMEFGDRALVDGTPVVLGGLEEATETVFLTTADSRPDEFNRLNDIMEPDYGVKRKPRSSFLAAPVYADYVRHVRVGSVAAMTRDELITAIRERTYHIG